MSIVKEIDKLSGTDTMSRNITQAIDKLTGKGPSRNIGDAVSKMDGAEPTVKKNYLVTVNISGYDSPVTITMNSVKIKTTTYDILWECVDGEAHTYSGEAPIYQTPEQPPIEIGLPTTGFNSVIIELNGSQILYDGRTATLDNYENRLSLSYIDEDVQEYKIDDLDRLDHGFETITVRFEESYTGE